MTFWLIWLALAVAVGILARQRGRGFVAWTLLGAVLTPLLGFVVLMMKKDLKLSETIDTITHDMDMTHVKCHKCAEYVMPEAVVCPNCKADLEPNPDYVKKRLEAKLAEEAELAATRQYNFIIAIGVAVALALIGWLATFL